MRARSSLSEQQRDAAVALFEAGAGHRAATTRLGASPSAVKRLHDRWRVRGRATLVSKPTKRSFSFEFKLAVVQRFLAGETKAGLAREFDLSSPKLIETWARTYRNDGDDGLRPKPKAAQEPTRTNLPRRSRLWPGCAGRTNGCGPRTPTWEKCWP